MLVIIGVEDMRAIQDECLKRPLNSKYKIFLLDEVHMLSNAAWNSMLKILEEPPEYVIFLFATTDPQKIIPTIMSRVQRFNFKRISVNGIYKRLKYILEQEQILDYDDSGVQYIARLARGGMRDAITTLEKCLDYSRDLKLNDVIKITSGGVSEDVLHKFMLQLLFKEVKEALLIFNEIYMSGIDISLFIKLFMDFLENCIKFLLTRNSEIVTISDNVITWLINNDKCLELLKFYLETLINDLNFAFVNEDLKILMESWVIVRCNS